MSLTGSFGAGEDATVDIGLTDIDTNSADYSNFEQSVQDAVDAYMGAGSVAFDQSTGTIIWTAGSDGDSMTDLLISLTLTDDTLLEGPQDFSIDLINSGSTTGAAISIDATATSVTTTINDTQGIGGLNDGPAEWSISGPAAGDEGGVGTYTIELSGAFGAGEDVSVNISLTDIGTNSSDYDSYTVAVQTAVSAYAGPGAVAFDATTGEITFTASSDGDVMTPLPVVLNFVDDVLLEGAEDFTLALSGQTSSSGIAVTVSPTAGNVTTTINDTQGAGGAADGPAEWSISGPGAADEGSIPQYTISLAGLYQAGEVVTVDLGLTDIDTNSDDYSDFIAAITAAVAANADVSFDGVSTLTYTAPSDGASMADVLIDLPLTDDVLIEGVEDYSLDLSNPTSGTGLTVTISSTADSVTTTITDTQGPAGSVDGPGEWSVSGPASSDEGSIPQYTVSLSGAYGVGEDATVDIALTDITTNNNDYADFTAAVEAAVLAYAGDGSVSFNTTTGMITFTASADGDEMDDLLIDLSLFDDVLVEGVEDFSIDLDNAASGTGGNISVNAIAGSVTTTINDTQNAGGLSDGPAQWSITGTASGDEGDTVSYTVSLGSIFGAGENATVDISLSDIDTNSADYSNFVQAVQDAIDAYTGAGSVAFDQTTGTITWTAGSDGDSMTDLVIDLSLSDDTLLEGPQDYSVGLSNSGSATGAAISIDATATSVTTTINDTQGIGGIADGPAEWSISGPVAGDEGGVGTYTVELSGAFGVGEDASVNITLTDIDTGSSDYAAYTAAVQTAVSAYAGPGAVSFDATTGVITFTAVNDGDVMTPLTITLSFVDDVLLEGVEDFTFGLSDQTSSSGVAVDISPTAASVTTTINDTQGQGGSADGPALWSITGPANSDEGTTPQYTVSLSGAFGANESVTVNLDLTDIDTNSADYGNLIAAITAAVSANADVSFDGISTLTYTAPADGAVMSDLLIDLSITADSITEGVEDFSLDLSSATSSTGVAVDVDANSASVTTTIADASVGTAAEWSITGPVSGDEGSTPQYTVSLSGAFGVAEVVSVDLSLTDLATNSSDYGDLLAAVSAAVAGNADVTFNAVTGTLTYTSPSDGASMADVLIDLSLSDDNLIEGPEDFTLSLSNAATTTGAGVSVSTVNDSVTTVIEDTQGDGGIADGPAEWSLTGDSAVDEGGLASYTLALAGSYGAGDQVSVAVDLFDIDTGNTDYASLDSAIQAAITNRTDLVYDANLNTLTWTSASDGSMMTPLVFEVAITDDTLIEGSEDYQVALSAPTSSTGITPVIGTDDALITTVNDTQGDGGAEEGPGQWSVSGPGEGNEGSATQFTVSLSGAYGEGEVLTVDLGLTDLDTNSSDYADLVAAIQSAVADNPNVTFDLVTGTLTYTSSADGASMNDLVIDLDLTDDGFLEGPEVFELVLSNAGSSTGASVEVDPTGGTLATTIHDAQDPNSPAGGSGSVTGPGQWSVSGPGEGNEGSATQFTVSLSGAYGEGEVLTVDLGLTDIDTNSSDYADLVAAIQSVVDGNPDVTFDPVTGTLTYTSPADGASMNDLVIDLDLTDDGLLEGPEVFELVLSNAGSSTGASVEVDPAGGTLATTIHDAQDPASPAGGSGNGATTPGQWSVSGPGEGNEGSTLEYVVSLSREYGEGEVVTVDLGLTDISTNASDHADMVAAIEAAVANNPDVTFDPVTGTLTFTSPADGASMADLVIDFTLFDDGLVEGPEEFTLGLSNPGSSTGAPVALDPSAASLNTIINDTAGTDGQPEAPGQWSVTGPTESAEGSGSQFTVSLSGEYGAGEVVTVDLGFTDISSSAGDHDDVIAAIQSAVASNPDVTFDPVTGTLTYTSPVDGASMPDLVFDIALTDDGLIEGPEEFALTLGNAGSPTGANVEVDPVTGSLTSTITDAQISDGEWSIAGPADVREDAVPQYTISLGGAYGEGVSVQVDVVLNNIDTERSDFGDLETALQTAADTNPDVTFRPVSQAQSTPDGLFQDAGSEIPIGTLIYTSPADGSSLADLVVDFEVFNDELIENPEDFMISLANASSSEGFEAGINSTSSGVLTTILDNDFAVGEEPATGSALPEITPHVPTQFVPFNILEFATIGLNRVTEVLSDSVITRTVNMVSSLDSILGTSLSNTSFLQSLNSLSLIHISEPTRPY